MKVNYLINNSKLLIISLLALTIFSCVPRERLVYFQGDLETIQQLSDEYAAKIQADDLLEITVYARNMEATRIFNQESNTGTMNNSPQTYPHTYLVDSEGFIEYPVLGRIKLAGLTRNEAIQKMKELLSKDIIDPGVSIGITNFRITVLGEVSKPGSYQINEEKVTLLEALGMAGDLTINGVRNNVTVIREIDGQRNFYKVDLTSSEVFTSPVYYLAQNDVVYVEPNKNKINTSSSTVRDVSFAISISSFIITIIALITR